MLVTLLVESTIFANIKSTSLLQAFWPLASRKNSMPFFPSPQLPVASARQLPDSFQLIFSTSAQDETAWFGLADFMSHLTALDRWQIIEGIKALPRTTRKPPKIRFFMGSSLGCSQLANSQSNLLWPCLSNSKQRQRQSLHKTSTADVSDRAAMDSPHHYALLERDSAK